MIAVTTASSGGKLPSETFACGAGDHVRHKQPDAVDRAAHHAAVRAAPAVLMLEARQHARQRRARRTAQ